MIAYKNKYHRILSCYFESRWELPSAHALVELPWQFMKSDQFEKLKLLMGDIKYLHLRSDLCNIYVLIQDFIPIQDNLNEPTSKVFSFIKNNIQRLSLYRNLFTCLYFELYDQCPDELDNYAHNWELPWVETHEIPIQIENEIKSGNSLQCFSEFVFENNTIASIAEDKKICFYLKQLGRIHCVSLYQNKELLQFIPVRSQRILTLTSSKNGDYLGIAYAVGETDIIHCCWDSDLTLIESTVVNKFNCLLPEFENPVIDFVGSVFYYQNIQGEIIAFDLITCKPKILLDQAMTQNGELSGIIILKEYRIFFFRSKKDTLVLAIYSKDETLKLISSFPSIDIVKSTAAEDQRFYLATSDFQIREYKLDHSLKEIRTWRIKDPPEILYCWKQYILWTSEGGNFYMHEARQINDYPIANETHTRYINALQIKTLNGNTLALVSGSRISFMASGGSAQKNILIASMLYDNNTYTLLQREQNDIYVLSSGKKKKQIFWKDADKDILISSDGEKNFLVMGTSGRGVFKYSQQRIHLLNNLPTMIKSISGLKGGGFLLLDTNHILYRLNSNLTISYLADLKLPDLRKQKLFLSDLYLVVYGIDLLDEGRNKLSFFEINPHNDQFIKMGSINYPLHKIEINNIFWNYFTKELYLIGRSDKGWIIKKGSIQEYLNYQEKQATIQTPDPVIQYSALSDNGKGLWITSSKGTLFYINMESLKIEIILSSVCSISNLGFKSDNMISDHFIVDRSKLFSCKLHSKVIPL